MTRVLLSALVAILAASGALADTLSADDIAYRLRMQAELVKLNTVVATTNGNGNSAVAVAGPATQGAIPAADRVELLHLFETSTTSLSPAASHRLQALCEAFRQLGEIKQPFRIIGHTDAVGSFERNQRLSEARAEAVRRYLVDDCGIAKDRLQAEGRGEADLRPNLNPRDTRQRRIEIQVAG